MWTLLSIVLTVLLLSGLKIAIYRMFDFQVTKKLFYEYSILYGIGILVVFSIFMFIPTNFLVLSILLLVFVLIIFEIFYFYKRQFSYESGKKYTLLLIVSYITSIMLLIVIIPIIGTIQMFS